MDDAMGAVDKTRKSAGLLPTADALAGFCPQPDGVLSVLAIGIRGAVMLQLT